MEDVYTLTKLDLARIAGRPLTDDEVRQFLTVFDLLVADVVAVGVEATCSAGDRLSLWNVQFAEGWKVSSYATVWATGELDAARRALAHLEATESAPTSSGVLAYWWEEADEHYPSLSVHLVYEVDDQDVIDDSLEDEIIEPGTLTGKYAEAYARYASPGKGQPQ